MSSDTTLKPWAREPAGGDRILPDRASAGASPSHGGDAQPGNRWRRRFDLARKFYSTLLCALTGLLITPQTGLAQPTAPVAPDWLRATPANAQVNLLWDDVPKATSYNLYRGVTPGGEGNTPYKTGIHPKQFTDSAVTYGTTYYYYVTAKNGAGESGPSAEVAETPGAPHHPLPWYYYVLALVLVAAVIAAAGKAVTGHWWAALMDGRNKASLSRLQMTMWTVIILAAVAVAVVWNLGPNSWVGFKIDVPEYVWALLGMSFGSASTSALILSTKAGQTADTEQLASTNARLSPQGATNVSARGKLLVRDNPGCPRWADIFRGDEVGNGATLDLSKLQMFLLTAILGVGYAVLVGQWFGHGNTGSLPAIDGSMLALLGISHAGYLTYKAAPHSASSDTPPVTKATSTPASQPPEGSPVLDSFALTPTSVKGGQAVSATIKLAKAQADNLQIAVQTANPSVAAPSSSTLTISAGQLAVSFAISTSAVGSQSSVTITATSGTESKSACLTVTP